MTDEHREKRRFPRLPAKHVVLVKKLGEAELEGFAKTMTVGLGGCMYVTDNAPGIGSGVELLISVHGKVVQAQGRVAYQLPKGGTQFQVGVEFLKMADGDLEVLRSLFSEDELSEES